MQRMTTVNDKGLMKATRHTAEKQNNYLEKF